MTTPIRRALLSVSDKTGVVEFAQFLNSRGVEILSTGGTAALLLKNGIPVKQVAAHTGFPEIMDGRVKTLHPKIHGGLLGRRETDDEIMRQHQIDPIDLLVVNLYPFAATIARADCTLDQAIENIDVGGPAMLRAAAKNHDRVTVIVDPSDYAAAMEEMKQPDHSISLPTRRRYAAKAYACTASYDSAIANFLDRMGTGTQSATEFPELLTLNFRKRLDLRYGENPHQQGAFYVERDARGAAMGTAQLLQGKPLSYNNVADGDTAFECVRQFDVPACVIVKHANPCGVAVASDILTAYEHAYRTDPTSAYGGIIAFNRTLDAKTAGAMLERQFVELIIVPGADAAAIELCAHKPNIRLLLTEGLKPSASRVDLRGVNGGLLAQTRDDAVVTRSALKVTTDRAPGEEEFADLIFAWQVCKFVKSNAIVYARGQSTIGIGAGQMSRVVSSRIAAMKAKDEGIEIAGGVMASDAFLPFRDGLDVAAELGIKAVIQPGGSIRDDEVIAAANAYGMAMVFTGIRHFRH